MKKALSCLLALLMAATVLSACAQDSAPSTDTTASPTVTTATPADTTAPEPAETEYDRSKHPDNLPADLNFGGTEITIAHRGGTDEKELSVTEISGDNVDDAIYTRNLKVSERLGVTFRFVPFGTVTNQQMPDAVVNGILANADEYEMVVWAQYAMLTHATKPLFYNMVDAPYLDFDQPWWNTDLMNAVHPAPEKILYFLTSDFNLNALKVTGSVFFNQQMYTDLYGSPEELYQMVLDGKWTIDKLHELVENAYVDLNGNQTADDEDRYGLAAGTTASTEMYAYPLGFETIRPDDTGTMKVVVNSEQNINITEKLHKLYYNNTGMRLGINDTYIFNSDGLSKDFMAGKLLFMAIWLKTCEYLRDMETPYGIIPYPKYDENQENYMSLVQDTASTTMIPITTTQIEATCAVLEALSAENYRTVIPQYYEVALKVKYARDNQSSQMIDIIHDTAMTDFGYAYNASVSKIGVIMRTLLGTSNANFASIIKANEKAATRMLDKLLPVLSGE